MTARARILFEIARLRHAGFSVAWNVTLRRDASTTLQFGEGCGMGRGSILTADGGLLHLGDAVQFGAYNYVACDDSVVRIGSRVLCSPFVSIIAANHAVRDGVVQWDEIDSSRTGVEIGDGCWLATNSVILPGVTLGERCVVGAGAVVARSFPAGSRLAGVPARALNRAAS